jgi:hypothetical protein
VKGQRGSFYKRSMAWLGERVRAIIGGIEQHWVPRESASWGTVAASFGDDGDDSMSGVVGRWCGVQWGIAA